MDKEEVLVRTRVHEGSLEVVVSSANIEVHVWKPAAKRESMEKVLVEAGAKHLFVSDLARMAPGKRWTGSIPAMCDLHVSDGFVRQTVQQAMHLAGILVYAASVAAHLDREFCTSRSILECTPGALYNVALEHTSDDLQGINIRMRWPLSGRPVPNFSAAQALYW